jgi:putative ABC transport system permease protein
MTRSDLRENIWMAIDTLRQHKLRSFLTILGVVIGTMTVIVIAAFVSGIDARVAKEIESFGTNAIYVFKFEPGFNFNPSLRNECASRSVMRIHRRSRPNVRLSRTWHRLCLQ